ncbi:MAG: hypothetical protein ACJAYU_004873 [Bradymonadia bacterium]|jgi:hypothetical protein
MRMGESTASVHEARPEMKVAHSRHNKKRLTLDSLD